MKMMEANKTKCCNLHRDLTLLLFSICFTLQTIYAQETDSLKNNLNTKRLKAFVITSSLGYSATMAGLHQLWYKEADRQSFRFFNDNREWKQVDKLGHFYSSFYFSYGTQRALRWSGVDKKRSDLVGAITGFLVLVPVEVFDGFSAAYGASTGDLLANAGGAVFFLGQQAWWNEIRIHPKFSFHRTGYAALRPDVLGDNTISQVFKDYNGQTYWLSVDTDKFVKFPKWLNIAFGYGAQDMVFARDHQNALNGYEPYRQFYLAVDFDLSAIKTKSKVLNTVIFLANIIRIPAPAVEFSPHGTRFHPLYF